MDAPDIMVDKLKVIAVANSPAIQQQLYVQLSNMPFIHFFGKVLLELGDAVHWWEEKQPDIIVLDLTDRELDAGMFIEAITLNPPYPCVVFTLHQRMDNQLILNAIRAGAKEFVHYPQDAEALAAAFERQWKQHCLLHQADEPQSQLIAVYGNKGGIGVTTVAVNLAVEWQVSSSQSVCLIDGDQSFSNIAGWLNIRPSHTLNDLAVVKTEQFEEELMGLLLHPHPIGLNVLFSCKAATDLSIPPTLWMHTLEQLKTRFDVIIVDLRTHQVDWLHQWLVEEANQVLLLSTPEIPSLYQTRQYLDMVTPHMPLDKFKLILNRWSMKGAHGLSNEALAEQFQYPIFAKLANDWDLTVEAVSLGKTLRDINPKAELVKNLRLLVQQLQNNNDATHSGGATMPTAPQASKKPVRTSKDWLGQLLGKH